jgi:hypothetical protein
MEDATDASDNNNDGTNNGATTTTGIFSNALNFDGTDYLELPDLSTLRGGQDLTVSLWFNSQDAANYQKLITKSSSYLSKDWELAFNGATGVVGFESEISDSGYGLSSPAGAATTNTWHNLVFTMDETNNILTLYLDGTQVAQDTSFSRESDSTSANVNIGRRGYTSDRYFTGAIDDVAVWDRVLSASEVSDIYSSGSEISCEVATTDCGGADDDENGSVSSTELLSYISLWRQGSVSSTELLAGINEWRNGC